MCVCMCMCMCVCVCVYVCVCNNKYDFRVLNRYIRISEKNEGYINMQYFVITTFNTFVYLKVRIISSLPLLLTTTYD